MELRNASKMNTIMLFTILGCMSMNPRASRISSTLSCNKVEKMPSLSGDLSGLTDFMANLAAFTTRRNLVLKIMKLRNSGRAAAFQSFCFCAGRNLD